MKYIVLIGRILFSLIFLGTLRTHFSGQVVGYAQAQGVPMASFLVPLAGIIATVGAISIILGYKARFGGWLIVLFLVPVTLYMHRFWTVADPMQMQMQMANFMKNIALLGGAFIITYFGAGPLSLDARAGYDKPVETAAEKEKAQVHRTAA